MGAPKPAGACRGGAIGPCPPLRSPNVTLHIGLSRKKVRECRLICRKSGFGPPPHAISKHAPAETRVCLGAPEGVNPPLRVSLVNVDDVYDHFLFLSTTVE